MKDSALKVLMAGTDPAGQGGIASVVAVLQQEGFFERNGARYVVTHSHGSRWHKLATAWRALWQVLAACVMQRPAVVHVHSAAHASFYRKSLILALARCCGCKTVFHLHAGGFKHFVDDDAGPWMRWWIRRTCARSSVLVALSDSWAAYLRELAPAARVRVIANAVRMPAPPRRALEQGGRILFLGRAEPQKGIFELLEAVALLKERFGRVMLVVGGDGDLDAVRRAAERLGIGEHVTLLGWIDAARRDAEMAQAEVFALPSYYEGLPMSMLEAMAAGKAVVVTAVGGIPEAVEDGGNGLLVAPRDPAALAAALASLLGDRALRERIGDAGRATVAARFSTGVVMQQMADMYSELGAGAAR